LTVFGALCLSAGLLLVTNCRTEAQKASGPPSEKVAKTTDWPHWRGPARNGISGETGWNSSWPAAGPKVLWRASVGTGFSSFSVSKGRVYTMGNSGNKDTVFCFDAANGQKLWSHTYPCPLGARHYEGGTHSTPTVAGGAVYTLSKRGHVFCLDAATGKVKWAKTFRISPPTWGFAGSPTVIGNRVYLNVGTAGVAMDKTTGRIIWNNGAGKSGYSTPVPFKLAGHECIALFTQSAVVGLMTSNGRKLWEYPWKTKYDVNAADPIFHEDKVFISSGYNAGCALIALRGARASLVWRSRNMSNHFNSCVLWKGHLYGFDETTLRCLSVETGREKWSERSMGKGSLMLADEKLIIMSDRGKLVIAKASPAKYEPVASAQILGRVKSWTTPILSGGRIYVRNAHGDVACVDVKGG